MNSVCLIGNLTQDPEVKDTSSEATVVRLRLAVNGRRKKGDNWVKDTGYFDVVTFGNLADVCAEHLSRGRKVAVSGRLSYQEWKTPEGQRRSKVEIIASEVEFLTPAPNKGGGEDASEAGSSESTDAAEPAPKAGRSRGRSTEQEPVAA